MQSGSGAGDPGVSIEEVDGVGRLFPMFVGGLPLLPGMPVFFVMGLLSPGGFFFFFTESASFSSSAIYLYFPVFKLRAPTFPMYPSREIKPASRFALHISLSTFRELYRGEVGQVGCFFKRDS